jgi:hypothetical protein
MNQRLGLLKSLWRGAGAFFAAGLLAWAQAGMTARPGTLNYVEGTVSLDGQPLAASAIGKTEVALGQVLETGTGHAEVLLFPGAYLRLGDRSAVQMVSPSLTDTRVRLQRGEALVEVDQIGRENYLAVLTGGTEIRVEKKGIYEFNADQPRVAVYDGKASLREDDKIVSIGKGKELALGAGAAVKPRKFDRDRSDELYRWSSVRSGYLAEANMSAARMVVVDNYPGWWAGTGWYWDPWFATWAFVPGGGFLNSPFGYGFYSPAYWSYGAPYYHGFPRRGIIGRRGGPVVAGRPAVRGFTGAPAGRSLGVGFPAGRSFGGGSPGARMGGGMHMGGGMRMGGDGRR